MCYVWVSKNLTVDEQVQLLLMRIENYPTEEKQSLGHSLNDMMLRCSFDSDACYPAHFKINTYKNSGNCFTLGDKTAEPSLSWPVTQAGPANGLIIELDIEQDEYLPMTESAGIKVLLHSGSEIVFPDNSGILAAPGFVTSIGIRKSESYLLPAPYGNCISQSSDTNSIKNLYEELGYTYTKDACMRTCLQKEIFKSCGCIESDVVNIINVLNYKDWLDLDQTKSIQICDELSERCIYKTVLQFQKGQLGCDELCPSACEQIVYHTTVSNSLWPSSAYIDTYIHFVNQTPTIRNKAYNWTAYPQAHVRNNFLRLEIYYETLNFEVSTSSPTFDWNSLLGNIGGQLGLWLGFSVLTAVEIVQLTMQVCVHVIHLQYDKYRKARTCRDTEIAPPPGSTYV
ncbi:amiloride-sensitive sodium channel subunit alpha-like [Physella acuta]|uniref:amiloride-sensitive sodium channel subunit alpha-like n=1 Tax=Physella acuta TaxID=109671 RepID=UPI0027DB28A2|nr:amiloride-sensitive sodium channel subunit alpha-like [Physella acuta]